MKVSHVAISRQTSIGLIGLSLKYQSIWGHCGKTEVLPHCGRGIGVICQLQHLLTRQIRVKQWSLCTK